MTATPLRSTSLVLSSRGMPGSPAAANKQTNKQTNIQTNRQTNKQTDNKQQANKREVDWRSVFTSGDSGERVSKNDELLQYRPGLTGQ